MDLRPRVSQGKYSLGGSSREEGRAEAKAFFFYHPRRLDKRTGSIQKAAQQKAAPPLLLLACVGFREPASREMLLTDRISLLETKKGFFPCESLEGRLEEAKR